MGVKPKHVRKYVAVRFTVVGLVETTVMGQWQVDGNAMVMSDDVAGSIE